MPPIRRRPPPPQPLSPEERAARLNPPPASRGKERWPGEFQGKPYLGYCTLGHYGCPTISHWPAEQYPEWLNAERQAIMSRELGKADLEQMCLLGHKRTDPGYKPCPPEHFARDRALLRPKFDPEARGGRGGVRMMPYQEPIPGRPFAALPSGAVVPPEMQTRRAMDMPQGESPVYAREMQIKQQYQAAARDEARQAGQTIPWGAGPRPAYPARVHYEGGRPVVRRAFGPEDLEEYGAARTEQYFERGTSVDPMGDAYVEVDVAGSPMKLRVPLLSENNRKRLAREGRVPPSKDEQIMAFVRAWWQGDQRVLDLLPISPAKPVVTEYDEKGIRKKATQLRAERRALTQSKRPPTEQELMAQRTALRTFWREKT